MVTLNCQGLHDAKRSVLFAWVNCFKPEIVCLQETHSTSSSEFSTRVSTESANGNNVAGYQAFSSPGSNRSRGVAFLFTAAFQVQSVSSDTDSRFQIITLSEFNSRISFVNIPNTRPTSDTQELRLQAELADLQRRWDDGEDVQSEKQDNKAALDAIFRYKASGAKIRVRNRGPRTVKLRPDIFFRKESSRGVRNVMSGIRNLNGVVFRSTHAIL